MFFSFHELYFTGDYGKLGLGNSASQKMPTRVLTGGLASKAVVHVSAGTRFVLSRVVFFLSSTLLITKILYITADILRLSRRTVNSSPGARVTLAAWVTGTAVQDSCQLKWR